jgi:hypothetical protein
LSEHALEEPVGQGAEPRSPNRACFGLASHGEQASNPQALLRTAEERLETAKAASTDRVVAE